MGAEPVLAAESFESQKAGAWLGGGALAQCGRALGFIPIVQRKGGEKEEGGRRLSPLLACRII